MTQQTATKLRKNKKIYCLPQCVISRYYFIILSLTGKQLRVSVEDIQIKKEVLESVYICEE